MAKMTLAVCDVCSEKDAKPYEVSFGDGVLKVDLCKVHSTPLHTLRSEVPKSLFLKHGARKKAFRIQVDPNAV